MKVKKLSANNRNFVAMAINDKTDKTVIYLYGQSKTTGQDQWYESKVEFTNSTALKYYYTGKYSVVFAGGLTKSSFTGWYND